MLPLSATAFTALLFVVGVGMGVAKASVYKYVPNYFPNDVGAVGGLVGMLGALGGFFLPKLFGILGRATGVPQAAFIALLGDHARQPGVAAPGRDADQGGRAGGRARGGGGARGGVTAPSPLRRAGPGRRLGGSERRSSPS